MGRWEAASKGALPLHTSAGTTNSSTKYQGVPAQTDSNTISDKVGRQTYRDKALLRENEPRERIKTSVILWAVLAI